MIIRGIDMENRLISVIVPVYNVEQYLPRCIESIVNQTYKNLEIILVDDGSTDNSGKVCDKFAEKDSRIKVFHKSNGGVSSARNFGIEKASGDYIGFVDSDDAISNNMYEILLNNAIRYKVKVSCCQVLTKNIDGSNEHVYNNPSKIYNKCDIVEGFFFDEFIKSFIVPPCNKIIEKEFLLKNNLKFKNYRLAEDFLFIFEVLSFIENLYYDNSIGYFYLHRENSAMTSAFSEKRFDYIDAINEIETICINEYDKKIQKKAHNWIFWQTLVNYRSMLINDNFNDFKDVSNKYKHFLKTNKKCWFFLSVKRKIDYILCMYFPSSYKIYRR